MQQGDSERAETMLVSIVKRRPDSIPARLRLAEVRALATMPPRRSTCELFSRRTPPTPKLTTCLASFSMAPTGQPRPANIFSGPKSLNLTTSFCVMFESLPK